MIAKCPSANQVKFRQRLRAGVPGGPDVDLLPSRKRRELFESSSVHRLARQRQPGGCARSDRSGVTHRLACSCAAQGRTRCAQYRHSAQHRVGSGRSRWMPRVGGIPKRDDGACRAAATGFIHAPFPDPRHSSDPVTLQTRAKSAGDGPFSIPGRLSPWPIAPSVPVPRAPKRSSQPLRTPQHPPVQSQESCKSAPDRGFRHL